MADVKSLGIHTPIGLPYLINEGLLPKEPKSEQYSWSTYTTNQDGTPVEEEVIYTPSCVVWSQSGLVRTVYRFDLDGEDVRQVVLTRFQEHPDALSVHSQHSTRPTREVAAIAGGNRSTAQHQAHWKHESKAEGSHNIRGSERALVIFLKSKAHIHFLRGAHHVVDLPFEVQAAFAAPRGVVLQRKSRKEDGSFSPPSKTPAPPPNSFLSSQGHSAPSLLRSPTLARSLRASQPTRPSPLSGVAGGDNSLDSLFNSICGPQDDVEEYEAAMLYTLTSPFSEVGLVAESIQQPRPRITTTLASSVSVEFDALDPAEKVVYASSSDDAVTEPHSTSTELVLIVTVNQRSQMVSVWHGWYIDDQSLSSLMKRRAKQKADKARRRSSFLSTSLGTGAATPAPRTRDGARESFAPGASLNVPGEPSQTRVTRSAAKKKKQRDDDEATMASQIDPDYKPSGSQRRTRESRRISSLISRGELSVSDARGQLGGTGSRRHTSFSQHSERRSFGFRRSRGSTPGSVFSRSIGPDDDFMDLDGDYFDGQESLESVVRHIRNTYEAVGVDNVLGSLDEASKNELILRKVHAFSFAVPEPGSPPSKGAQVHVVRLDESLPSTETDRRKLALYLHHRATGELINLVLAVKEMPIWPDVADTPYVNIPILLSTTSLPKCQDTAALRSTGVSAVALGGLGIITNPSIVTVCPLPDAALYRVSNPLEMRAQGALSTADTGRNRTLPQIQNARGMRHPGAHGTFDEIDGGGALHRRQVKLAPQDPMLVQLISVCRLVLPSAAANLVQIAWCHAHVALAREHGVLADTKASVEWVAVAATIFVFAIPLVDAKARASLRVSQVAAVTGSPKATHTTSAASHHRAAIAQTSWDWAEKPHASRRRSSSRKHADSANRDRMLVIAAALADTIVNDASTGLHAELENIDSLDSARRLMLALHIYREEQKLNTLSSSNTHIIACIVAQLGLWLGREAWSPMPGTHYSTDGASAETWAYVSSHPTTSVSIGLMDEPVGVYEWLDHSFQHGAFEHFPTIATIAQLGIDTKVSEAFRASAANLTPRIIALSETYMETQGLSSTHAILVETAAKHGITTEMLETLPESVAAPLRAAIAECEKEPPTTWSNALLTFVGRDDLDLSGNNRHARTSVGMRQMPIVVPIKDVQTITHALDAPVHAVKTREADRNSISQLLFKEDRRLVEATGLMHFHNVQIAECPKQPDWSDAFHLEQQRKVMQWVTTRMIALPAGDGMIHFDSQIPLMTEKYHLPSFSMSCIMQPMGHTITTDRSGLTEEKVNWAYFHAGVSVGLRISRNAKGIDTSWLVFNKPNDLTNRHAGLLLALGLNGHLRSLAKWLSFKYLTPKHTMTSVGLLLGIAASHMGTMDSLITRMLSIHITAMLPPGAAELNVSSLTQTAGLMGIGLLYCNTEHRRMSELTLHEIEMMDVENVDNSPDTLRDESYRLAAGFALGLINLAKGKDLKSLHGMRLLERLLSVAVGPRPVSAVHVFDKATAGAIVAIALVYMKSGDKAIARKIDIPDTENQFDHVRSDMLLLRSMAKHLILWDSIQAQGCKDGIPIWIRANLPGCYKSRLEQVAARGRARSSLSSSDVPFYSIATGLAWALSLRYAGSGNEDARDEILALLDLLHGVKSRGDAHYYDAKLARTCIRRCIDVLALAAATVMAGTGDLKAFRYLRRLHGRTDAETPYGSHLAAHLAIGVLFLGGGTYTLGTSDLAVAALMISFYPIFPTDVQDNRVHLQAFRHLWVFAAEPRCIIIEDIDTHRPISMPLLVTLRNGTITEMQAPCLLPELESIAMLQTNDPAYWRTTLDFASNPAHLLAFRKNQRIQVRRCPAGEAHSSLFGAALSARSSGISTSVSRQQLWDWVFSLPALRDELSKPDIELILPPDVHSSVHTDERGTVIDDRIVLSDSVKSNDRNALWNLRLLFGWVERARETGDGRLKWIGSGMVEAMKAAIEERSKRDGFAASAN